jgi:hypothetical protein
MDCAMVVVEKRKALVQEVQQKQRLLEPQGES